MKAVGKNPLLSCLFFRIVDTGVKYYAQILTANLIKVVGAFSQVGTAMQALTYTDRSKSVCTFQILLYHELQMVVS